jgi:WD40 repeat protein
MIVLKQVYDAKSADLKLEYESEAQTTSFTCLDLNSYELNSFAAGCDDGTIGIWDIDSNGIPKKSLNLSSTATANDSINVVKWNKEVNSILAAASNSNVHVWDIRKSINSGPIMRVHDNNATSIWGSGPQSLMISRSLAWSYSHATTLIIANSNDANPIIQLWDLRYATCPLNYFKGSNSQNF